MLLISNEPFIHAVAQFGYSVCVKVGSTPTHNDDAFWKAQIQSSYANAPNYEISSFIAFKH